MSLDKERNSSEARKAEVYDFTPIQRLTVCNSANFWGRVIFFKEPRKTRGRDYAMTMVVADDSIPEEEANGDGLSVSIFKPELDQFPNVKSVGDIVQFRHMKMFESSHQALGFPWSSFEVYHQAGPQKWTTNPPRTLSATEMQFISKLSAAGSSGYSNTPRSPNRVSRESLSISQVVPGIYFDTVAQVAKVYPKVRDDQINLLVSDFSENKLLWIDTENSEAEPWLENATLPITCWDANVLAAEKLCSGQVVKFQNLHSRLIDGHLVASLHNNSLSSISLLDDQSSVDKFKTAREQFIKEKRRKAELQVASLVAPSVTAIGVPQNGTISSLSTVTKSNLICFNWLIKGRVQKMLWPKKAEDLIYRGHSSGKLIWCFSFEIVDDSMEAIEVFVAEDEALFFLNGLKPVDHPSYFEQCWNMLQRFCDLSSKTASPFAIQSFTAETESSSDARMFRLFKTRIAN